MEEGLVKRKIVKCLTNSGYEAELTIGKSYIVTVTTYNSYFVVNDLQVERIYPQWFFEKDYIQKLYETDDAVTEW